MKINKTELSVGVDVDDTLIIHDHEKYPKLEKIEINYYGHKKIVAVHEDHVQLLKAYKKRGYEITVWSNNGVAHAVEVVRKLGLEDFVYEARCKFNKHMDDQKDATQIVGQHVYIPIRGGQYEF